jgi:ParB family chromosome partitioning protein
MKSISAVSADTFQTRMIEISKLRANEKNFYAVSDIEILADDIERQGLKHNLVVVENPEKTFTIISGHRRYAAVTFLISEGRYGSKFLPCFVAAGRTETQILLDLIMLNATARVMTDAEKFSQFEKITELFSRDKTLFGDADASGRKRDKIADALKISPAQVGKMENIKRNAAPEITEKIKRGELSVSTANEVAKLEKSKQLTLLGEEKITNKNVGKILREAKNSEKTRGFESENFLEIACLFIKNRRENFVFWRMKFFREERGEAEKTYDILVGKLEKKSNDA